MKWGGMRTRSGLTRTALAGVLLAVLVVPETPALAIHRGEDADIAAYPFMVSLRLADTPDSPRCGGTLIEPDIVLTAAHCVASVAQGGIVAVVGADIPAWADAPKVATLGHAVPETYDLRVDNRDDIAVVRLATPQATPTVALAPAEARVGGRVVTLGWGCTNAPPVCQVMATSLQSSDQAVLDEEADCGLDVFWTRPRYHAPTTICTKGVEPRSTINRGDSGGPLLVRAPCSDRLRQVGVTSLGADSKTKLYAGFTSIPVEAEWIAQAIATLRAG
jgi:secreted trypsin-like serine protease